MTDAVGSSKKKYLLISTVAVLVLVAVGGVGTSVFFYRDYQRNQNSDQAKAKELVGRLGGFIDLPSSTPTVVTVVSKDKLANQALAARVKDQDTLLIYGEAKRIVIYRPSTKKVVDMLSFETQAQLPTATTAQPQAGSGVKTKP